jgi:hypothetical protein
MAIDCLLSPVSEEFSVIDFGDPRRKARLARIADQLGASPESSLPKTMGNPSQLEGAYRFFSNPQIEPEQVLDAHIGCAVRRATEAGKVLVIHDTTEFGFGGEGRKGLRRISDGKKKGFLSHFSLCVGLDGQPLGVLGLYAWGREPERKGHRSQQQSQYDPDRESLRWTEAMHRTGELLCGKAEAIHITDREGDCMELMADSIEHGHRFVIRLAHDRRLDPGRRRVDVPMLFETLATAPLRLEREVAISERKDGRPKQMTTRFPVRKMRRATLEVRAQPLLISPGNGAPLHLPDGLCLNFVEVSEPNPPEGEEPILWRLVTTEPIDTVEQVAAVVDMYRCRWVIEEFFKAIKSGCNYQELQLETAHALLVALSVYVAVAWRMLLMRWLDRYKPNEPATAVLSTTQVQVLTAVRQKDRKPLPSTPTVHDAFMAIAVIGGHLTQNGPPGWMILSRGFAKLITMEIGWVAASEVYIKRSDQS